MPAKTPINPLDPFGDEDEFKTKEIRHSRSREADKLIKNVEPEKKAKPNAVLVFAVVLGVIVIACVVFLVILPGAKKSDESFGEDPNVNPTGREVTSEYTGDFDNPELRASEQEKLNTVLSLIQKKDWEYANALFETIFPDYLDSCGKYDYYRSAVTLADNFEEFTIDRELAESRMNVLVSRCDRGTSE